MFVFFKKIFFSDVSTKIATDIININANPVSSIVFMLLMVSTLVGSGSWLLLASVLGLPVSTTHSIIGSIVGCGWLIGGFNFVNYRNLILISVSWILSPVLGLFFFFNLLDYP